MIKLRRLGHAAFYVRDLDRALGFYVAGVGLTVTGWSKTADGREQAFLRAGALHHDLCLIQSDQAPGLDHVAYEVGSWWELQRFADYCQTHGIEVLSGPEERVDEGNCKSLLIQCPFGLRLELFAGMAEYDVPASYNGMAGAKPRLLGHVAPVLVETNPVRDFLIEHLGLRHTGSIPSVDCNFMSSTELDHDLTLMKLHTQKGYDVPHISYKVGTVAEMEAAAEWARSRGFRIIYGPGKRPGGSIRTLDVYDHDGNMFEWYHGMDLLHADIPVRNFQKITVWGG